MILWAIIDNKETDRHCYVVTSRLTYNCDSDGTVQDKSGTLLLFVYPSHGIVHVKSSGEKDFQYPFSVLSVSRSLSFLLGGQNPIQTLRCFLECANRHVILFFVLNLLTLLPINLSRQFLD